MRKVELRMNEQNKYNVISNLVNNNGNKRNAAVKLNLSIRQIDRLIKIYREKGKLGFIHGNRSKTPTNKMSQPISNDIIQLYKNKYNGFNFRHFQDFLEEHENIKISYNCLYKLLTKNGIYSPKIRKATKIKLKKQELLLKHKNKETIENLEDITTHLLPLKDSHPRQEKPKYFGEVIEMDGSIHLWFGKTKVCLHLAIDVCTGTIVGGIFQPQETLRGYYIVFKQILEKYGIPVLFKTDNRTVFNYESLSKDKRTNEKDVLTQFGYACKTFGVDLKTTSVSQAKGCIERANGTFQGRLVQELKLKGITTIDEANEYLINVFIPSFNKKFAIDYHIVPSAFESIPSSDKINNTLSILTPRKIDNGNSIKFKNKYYQPYNSSNKLVTFKPHTRCLVIETFDGTLLVTIDEVVYILQELKTHKEYSEEIDGIKETITKEKKIHIPLMTHPWKVELFNEQIKKAHTNHVYA